MVRDSLKRRQVVSSLRQIRPALQMNESDVELVELEGSKVIVAFKGRVVESFSSVMLLKIGMELALKRELPGFVELQIESPGNRI